MRNPGASCLAVAVAALQLVACSSSDDSRSACTRSALRAGGPGDAANHFPTELGATWIYETTEVDSGASPVASRMRVAVTGTAHGSALDATVFTSTPLGWGAAPPSTSFVAEGSSGVTFVGDEDPDDTLEPQLVPYELMRFPLTPGESFVQLDCRDLDFGEDLDGDGRNERLDLQTVVTVLGAEALTARVGDLEAVRVDTRLSMALHTTRAGSFVSNGERSEWYAPGIGLVRAATRQELLGETFTETTELLAYSVAGARFPVPMQLVVAEPIEDVVAGGALRAYSVSAASGAPHVLAAFGLGSPVTLEAYGDDPLFSSPTCVAAGATSVSECASSSTSGVLHLGVRAVDPAPTPFVVLAAMAPPEGPHADEVAVVAPRAPALGQVGPRGRSHYVAAGLTPGAQVTVWMFGLTEDADLHVYGDETRSFELGCTLGHYDADRRAESCTFVSLAENAYLSVSSGELNRDGAGFLLLVWDA